MSCYGLMLHWGRPATHEGHVRGLAMARQSIGRERSGPCNGPTRRVMPSVKVDRGICR